MRFKYKSAGNYKLEIAKQGDVGYDLKSTKWRYGNTKKQIVEYIRRLLCYY